MALRTRLLVLLTLALAGCPPSGEVRSPRAPDDAVTPVEPDGTLPVSSGGNQRIRSFAEAKRVLRRIYDKHRIDLYCGCIFAPDGRNGWAIDLEGCGYATARDGERAHRVEWEHAVAAATFGRSFREWTLGDDRCVDGKGKRFKGRRCAERSPEFARMEGDLHNLFPVVGEVNGLRSDLPIGILDPPDRTPPHHKATNEAFTFGACKSTISAGVFYPRAEVRGDIARASLYMEAAYPSHLQLDPDHRALFTRWSAEDPPDAWEAERNRVIADLQGNANPFIDTASSTH